ncbi:hypothetical protein [Mycoplana rhizolycopersici]|uniref:Uncharacterized protein n=1 Tax=Mycoplana rhizolycopersici TaxID=2746702 RepID=A0ABX2QJ56_9HYPH|nr:hypothetical protein [Rhizobium rhizolycopersici]NVP57822.1 hypothetical protein [Rhizobium rhizolycopersici]
MEESKRKARLSALSSIAFDQAAHAAQPFGRDGFRVWTASERSENDGHFLHLPSWPDAKSATQNE